MADLVEVGDALIWQGERLKVTRVGKTMIRCETEHYILTMRNKSKALRAIQNGTIKLEKADGE